MSDKFNCNLVKYETDGALNPISLKGLSGEIQIKILEGKLFSCLPFVHPDLISSAARLHRSTSEENEQVLGQEV